MAEIYIAWIPGLLQNLAALKELKGCGLIAGIEMSRIHAGIKNLKQHGLKLSIHNPMPGEQANFADPDLLTMFDSEQGQQLLKLTQGSDVPVVGFHCGFSAEKVYKMRSYPDIPEPDTLIHDREQLLRRFHDNFIELDQKINLGIELPKLKRLLLETMDYSRSRPIDWTLQENHLLEKKEKIEQIIKTCGINAGFMHVTEISFVRNLLNSLSGKTLGESGYLFDVAHVLITADAMIYEKKFDGSIADFFENAIETLGKDTFQIHLNVPSGDENTGFSDAHKQFRPGEWLSDIVLDLSVQIYERSPNISVITLEMANYDVDPVQYVKEMIQQAKLVTEKLS